MHSRGDAKKKNAYCIKISVLLWQITIIMIQMHPRGYLPVYKKKTLFYTGVCIFSGRGMHFGEKCKNSGRGVHNNHFTPHSFYHPLGRNRKICSFLLFRSVVQHPGSDAGATAYAVIAYRGRPLRCAHLRESVAWMQTAYKAAFLVNTYQQGGIDTT